MKPITERYKVLREEVRLHNKALDEKGKTVRVKATTIWKYIVTGDTASKKLLKPEVLRAKMVFGGMKCDRYYHLN